MNPVVGLTYWFDPAFHVWRAIDRPDIPPAIPEVVAGYGSSPYGERPYGD